MKTLTYFLLLSTCLLLPACTPDNSAKTKLFEDQRNALDKAKAVDAIVQQQNLQTQQSLEKQAQ